MAPIIWRHFWVSSLDYDSDFTRYYPMKRIVLIRHAKSSWSDPDQEDIARPLNQRGRLSASLMAAQLVEISAVPQAAWVSPAVRTVETWDRMQPLIGDVKGKVHKALYMADPDTMLSILHATDDAADTVALVGHQPGVSALTRKLSDGHISTTCARAFSHFPTAAVAVLSADVDKWSKLAFKSCRFSHFSVPKDLV
ncbi:phosphohistidine phosphatase [Monaibacterium marinum]|uniref:Phosphohistidine phosphatase n=2 Tax=Pontivivens marinum TaxID=1690039 RepID=A0A2C9CSL7_9RHOB|nr:phosphohistidine phosphatase [Monaibacterium marinum]